MSTRVHATVSAELCTVTRKVADEAISCGFRHVGHFRGWPTSRGWSWCERISETFLSHHYTRNNWFFDQVRLLKLCLKKHPWHIVSFTNDWKNEFPQEWHEQRSRRWFSNYARWRIANCRAYLKRVACKLQSYGGEISDVRRRSRVKITVQFLIALVTNSYKLSQWMTLHGSLM